MSTQQPTDYNTRKFDIVVYGATGFTGELVCEYLAQEVDRSICWAIAGRSLAKLEKVKEHLIELNPHLKSLELLIADSDQIETLDHTLSQTRIVVSTVGPFKKYGTPVIESCIRQKTHYLDICGEHP
ncbi:hypothetical protein MBANPS3_010742 [Mucor bainieri]